MPARLPAPVAAARRAHAAARAAFTAHRKRCHTCHLAWSRRAMGSLCDTGYGLAHELHMADQRERNARIATGRPGPWQPALF